MPAIVRVVGRRRWCGVPGALLLVAALCCLAWPATARADDPSPDELLQQVGFDQRLGVQVPLDLTFRDEMGQAVRLGDYFGSQPVILTLSYYHCPNLCPLVLDGLATSLQGVDFAPGDAYTIVTVSIDPGETPADAAAKKADLLQHHSLPGSPTWHFLTGGEGAIKQLASTVGFRYAYDARQRQYAHPAGVMIMTPAGKLARYFYGIEYAARDLRLGLVEASAGTIGTVGDRLLLICYHYDPKTGRYAGIVDSVVKAAALGVALSLGLLLAIQFRREFRQRAGG